MESIACPVTGCMYKTPVNVVALINAHALTHSQGGTEKIEKVKRPIISPAGSSEEWAYFESRWTDYKAATKVNGQECVIQLLECCDDALRKDLTRLAGGSLTDKTETDVLIAIRTLAVREENTMVARVTLHNMRQDRDEPVRNFGARLRGQAGICKFLVTCPGCANDVNYREEILRDVLTRGIIDSEVQLDLLGDSNQDMTVEQVLKFVEAKEAGKRSASRLLDSHGVEAARSSYRKDQSNAVRQKRHTPGTDRSENCSYCGKKGHGKRVPARVRQRDCPAYDHTCQHCSIKHHFESMCRSKDKPYRTANNTDECEGALFDALCTTTNVSQSKGYRTIRLDHHLYSHLCDRWIKQSSKAQPFIKLTTTLHPDDYEALGYSLSIPQSTAILPAMADTGCQSCLAGIKTLQRLGLSQSDLIPVTTKMHATNNNNITILGAAALRFAGKNKSGDTSNSICN